MPEIVPKDLGSDCGRTEKTLGKKPIALYNFPKKECFTNNKSLSLRD